VTEQQGRMWRGGAVEEDLAISHSVRFTVHVQYVEENITSINNKFEAAVGWKIIAKYDLALISLFLYMHISISAASEQGFHKEACRATLLLNNNTHIVQNLYRK
jgi:hypothetical protein